MNFPSAPPAGGDDDPGRRRTNEAPPPAGGFGAATGRAFGPIVMPVYHEPSETYAKWTFVLGLLSLFGLFLCFVGIALAGVAIAMAIFSMKRCDRHPDLYGGRGYAVAGLVCGLTTVVLSVCALALAFLVV